MTVKPLKEQIYLLLRKRITGGEYPPGFRLPPEVDLAAQLQISRNTLRSVLLQLEHERQVVRIPSKGTFVMPYCENACDSVQRFLVFCDRDRNYYHPCHYMLPGMAREAAVRNCELEICDLQLLYNCTPERLHNFLVKARINGIIIIASNFTKDDKLVKLLNTQNIPICQVYGRPEDYNYTNWALLYCNSRNAWKEALSYLAGRGHKRVAITNMQNTENNVRYWPRAEFVQLLESLELENRPELIVDYPVFDHASLKDKLVNLFRSSRPRPTAVLCFSDHQAPVVYGAMKSLGLRIPQDVEVMGFCGIPDGKYMEPALSTIDMDYLNIGARAVAIMMDSVQWYFQEHRRPLEEHPFYLIERESTGGEKIFV